MRPANLFSAFLLNGKDRVTVKIDGAEPAAKDVEVDGAAVYRIALTLKPVAK